MTSSSVPFPSSSGQGRGVPNWLRSITPPRAGIIVFILALLFTLASYVLHSRLNYPEILIDRAQLAHSLIAQGPIAVLLGFLGLLLCGLLLIVISLRLLSYLVEKRRRRLIFIGCIAGICWTLGGLLGLLLVALWRSAAPSIAQVLALLLLVLTEIVAPLLLAVWSVIVAWQFRAHRASSLLGAIGLLLVPLRSLAWVVNALLTLDAGYYGSAGLLALLALLGESLWLTWLFLLGFSLMRRRQATMLILEHLMEDTQNKGEENT